jgi:hypothetical protein
VVCWTGDEAISVDNITRLERAITHIAAQTAAGADPVFVPRDESSAWAWLPLGIRDRFDAAASNPDAGIGRPVGDSRHDVELALQASGWLGSSVLQLLRNVQESAGGHRSSCGRRADGQRRGSGEQPDRHGLRERL